MLRKCEECSCIEQTVSYNGSYAPKFIILNSELSDSTLLFDIILILHIRNVLLMLHYAVAFVELTNEYV